MVPTRHAGRNSIRHRTPSFKVIGAPHTNGCGGGSLALVYAENLNVMAVPNPTSPTRFELQTVFLVIAGEHFVITGVYRPPSTSTKVFFDELTNLFDATAFIGG